MPDLVIGVKRMLSVEGSEIDEDDAPLQSPKTPGDREEAERLLRESSFSFSPPEYSPPALDAPEPQSGQLPQPRPLRPMRLGGEQYALVEINSRYSYMGNYIHCAIAHEARMSTSRLSPASAHVPPTGARRRRVVRSSARAL